MPESSPARLYCLLAGAALVIAGIVGFFYEASFATGEEIVSGDVLGVLAVNGWHNVAHLVIGALLLVAAGGPVRGAAIGAGAFFVAVSVLGFLATGDAGIGFLADHGRLVEVAPVNNADNVAHLLLGVTGILAALATSRQAPGAPASAKT